MCAVSAIVDYGRKQWRDVIDTIPTLPYVPYQPSKEEMEAKLAAFMKLVEAARKFDEETGQPDCEDSEKVAWLARVMKTIEGMK